MKLTAIFIKEEESDGYSAFFKEYPGVISQGETIEQAESLLFQIFPIWLQDTNKTQDEEFGNNEYQGIERTYNI